MCDVQVRVPEHFQSFARCKRTSMFHVPTDFGMFLLCTQHFKMFKKRGVWVIQGDSQEFIRPANVLLSEREALGV